MRLLRGLAGALLWIVSAVLGLVAILLCVTIILLPVGLPLLGYTRRLFALSFRLILPSAVSHPVHTAERSLHKRGRKTKKTLTTLGPLGEIAKQGRHMEKRVRKHLPLVS